MVLHRLVRKRDQSSFSLQAQLFSFATTLSSRSSTVLPLAFQANLLVASHPACQPASRLPRAKHARKPVSHITSYLPPIYVSLSKSGTLSLSSLSSLISPFSPRPMPATAGKSDLKKKLKQSCQ